MIGTPKEGKDYRIRLNAEEMAYLVACMAFVEDEGRKKNENAPTSHAMGLQHQLRQRLSRPGSARRW